MHVISFLRRVCFRFDEPNTGNQDRCRSCMLRTAQSAYFAQRASSSNDWGRSSRINVIALAHHFDEVMTSIHRHLMSDEMPSSQQSASRCFGN